MEMVQTSAEDEMGDGLGPFGSDGRLEAARKDFESGNGVASWSDVREEILKRPDSRESDNHGEEVDA